MILSMNMGTRKLPKFFVQKIVKKKESHLNFPSLEEAKCKDRILLEVIPSSAGAASTMQKRSTFQGLGSLVAESFQVLEEMKPRGSIYIMD